jgi:1-acyl-sn-glycerol-3-phosphate acyltransferase
LEKDSPAIFVANHRSRLDGPMLLPLLKNTGVLMKTSYARMPVFSFFVKHLDFVSVNSESVVNLAAAINRCKELFNSGSRLLIFPEGARSRSARMLPFKDLAFRLSMETGCPVVPMIVHCDHPFMAKMPGSLVPPFRMKFVVRSLPPMLPEKNERPSDFAERVRRRMAEEIRVLDKGNCLGNQSRQGASKMKETKYDLDQILKILPHRPPFLFVDRVIKLVPDQLIVAEREIRPDEPHFAVTSLEHRLCGGTYHRCPGADKRSALGIFKNRKRNRVIGKTGEFFSLLQQT